VKARPGFEDLARELEALAPRFGRARDAVERLAERAREGEPEGVARAGRRVAEEIARGLVGGSGFDAAREGGLDALFARLDEGATRLPVPAHARAHLDLLRRPGAGSDRAAGREDAFARLTSAIALLRWYAWACPETVVSVRPPRPAGGSPGPARARAAVAAALIAAVAAGAVLLAVCRSR
jgi:hypothetical protein